MDEVKWIKMSTSLPNNRKIKQIRKLPNGDTIVLAWVFLMCLAGQINDDGMVYFTKEIPYTEEMLAYEFDMEVNTIRLALNTFDRFHMIEIVDNVFCLSSWEKWQATDELSKIREQTRNRVSKHREKQRLKAAGNVTCNVTVTECNGTDKNREEEIREEEIRGNVIGEAPPPTTSNRFVPPTVEEVKEYCKERGNGINPQRFVDHYTSNGWLVGKNKMKDWKAAVRTWERNTIESKGKAAPTSNADDSSYKFWEG